MKKLILSSSFFLAAVLCMYACKKSPVELFDPSRAFTPTNLKVSIYSDTSVNISWNAAVNSPSSGVTYTVQFATDTTFTTPVFSLVTSLTSITVTDDSLLDGVRYYVRVFTNAYGTTPGSLLYGNADTSGFTFAGVQLLNTPSINQIIDVAAILSWTPTPSITTLLLTAPNGDTTRVSISAAAVAAGVDTIYSLTPETKYTAQLFAGTKSMGTTTFTTDESATGANVIDLRSVADADDPNILVDTLPLIPSGSTVLLQGGMTYSIPYNAATGIGYTFNQSVTIETGMAFGASQAIISIGSNLDASGTMNSLVFNNVAFATPATNGSGYVFNISQAATINTLDFENCTTQGSWGNSFVRLKATGQTINNLVINNCVIDSFGVANKYALIYPDASGAIIDNIKITNSTFYYIDYFIEDEDLPSPNSTTIAVSNCTFNNFLVNDGYIFNYNDGIPASLSFTDCIFGSTVAADGIKSGSGTNMFTNCFATSDCTFSGSSPSTTTGKPTALSVAASSLFASPLSNPPDLTLQNTSIVTGTDGTVAGDPRWIP